MGAIERVVVCEPGRKVSLGTTLAGISTSDFAASGTMRRLCCVCRPVCVFCYGGPS